MNNPPTRRRLVECGVEACARLKARGLAAIALEALQGSSVAHRTADKAGDDQSAAKKWRAAWTRCMVAVAVQAEARPVGAAVGDWALPLPGAADARARLELRRDPLALASSLTIRHLPTAVSSGREGGQRGFGLALAELKRSQAEEIGKTTGVKAHHATLKADTQTSAFLALLVSVTF
jgi:hypothetical protein